jgi:phenylalanyl-tRNA synthetase beta chain
MEAVTFSFMAGATARHFLPSPVALANPISVDLDVLRPSILGNLLAAAQRNAARGEKDTALFEVGPVYLSPSERDQFLVATGLRVGLSHPRQWQGGARPVDFFDAKADCLALLEEFSVPTANLQIERAVPAYYHPGRAASLRLGPAILGYCGEMHPGLLGASGLGEAMAVGFELFLDRLPQPRVKAGQARAPLVASPYQAVERDFAFLVDRGQSVANLLKAARGADKLLITAARVFDLYEGEKLPAGKKSVALAITLQASDRTLTDKEIEETSARIVAAVTRATGAELRT